jgi:hypothetical protein
MIELTNLSLLAVDALFYFAVLAGLFRLRHRLGIGAFFCALGVMHFIETYLASIFYVSLPFGIVTSPGSSVLFTGKLMLLLLVYIREDAKVVRQPIYGLLIGNLLMMALAVLMRHHVLIPLGPGRVADFGFLDEMGALMIWGTALLFIDCILILLYEQSRRWLSNRFLARLALAGAAVLSFDQAGFYLGLRLLTGAPIGVLIGGWIAKMAAVAIYSSLVACYLRWLERPSGRIARAHSVSDVFDMLTYRERYEELLSRALRGAAGAHRPRRAHRHVRPRPPGIAGTADDRRSHACRDDRQPASGRHRPFQELQRPFRPCRRRRRAPAHRARDHGGGARVGSGVQVRRGGIRGDL